MLKKRDTNNNSQFGKRERNALADVICYCKMTSVMTLDVVMSFLRLEDVTINVNVCDTVQLLAVIHQCNCEKLEEAEDFKCVFVVRNGSALARELLSNFSLFVG